MNRIAVELVCGVSHPYGGSAMSPDRDLVLVETVRTHRARLVAAFLYGELTRRRRTDENLRRFACGIVLAAFVGVGCIAYAVVSAYLGGQAGGGR
jgi:cation transporter-like permease